jgi:hypothetical protein
VKRKVKRVDRKHRFQLRVAEVIHSEVDVLAFKHNVSLNLVYAEAIEFAVLHPSFLGYLAVKFPRDDRRGHFVFVQDEYTKRLRR